MSSKIDEGIKSVAIGLLANAFLAGLKITTGILGNSFALIADGIESITDIPSSIIVFSGLKIAQKPADHDHPYGHGKAESLAASIVSLLLIIAAFVIAKGSMTEILNPATNEPPKWFTLVTLVLVVVIKETLFRRIGSQGEEVKSSAMKTDAWHHRSDAITSGVAFIGICIALIGGHSFASADDWAAFAASFIVAFNGANMLRTAVGEIMDKQYPIVNDKIKEIAMKIEGIIDVEKCYVRKSGFQFLVDMHITVDGNESVQKGHDISHKIKDALLASDLQITHVMVHIEPNTLNALPAPEGSAKNSEKNPEEKLPKDKK
ncbi:MAG: cation diffusion facilitator family transporter [Bacteroidota bacterium]|nr:cation diffusion facilitator family transporter [Bacteroidota bacterium]